MSISTKKETITTIIVSVPGRDYDRFNRTVTLIKTIQWVALLGTLGLVLWYVFEVSPIWMGLPVLFGAMVASFVIDTALDSLIETITAQLALRHGWQEPYPYKIQPDYQTFLHE